MIPVFTDYETYYSVEHSLSNKHLNPITYVMHPETELQSLAIAVGEDPIVTAVGEDEIRYALAHAKVEDKMLVAHNGIGFDHLISAWRMKVKPKAWGCTMSMARPVVGLKCGVSLGALAEEFNLPSKLDFAAVNTKGRKLADLAPDEIQRLLIYNRHDTWLCRALFNILMERLSLFEIKLIDQCCRMIVEPALMANRSLLESAYNAEVERKNASLFALAIECGVFEPNMTPEQASDAMRPIVMSQPQFAGLLEKFGAVVPMKKNKKGKLIPALAKTDQGLADLLEYEAVDGNDYAANVIRVATACRLEVKSTQLETRLKTFKDVSGLLDGYLPMPLNYCGAMISWRMSGSMKMNVQNQPRVIEDAPKPSDAIRLSVIAPPGKKIVVVDSSNIELRVSHTIAGETDTVARLRLNEDMYCWFASRMFGRTITKADKSERFIGKVAMLSLQYGASWESFQNMARTLSGGKTNLDEQMCRDTVAAWRVMFPKISDYKHGIWGKCEKAILAMYTGDKYTIDEFGLLTTGKEVLHTPAGYWLQYPGLHQELKVRNGVARQGWVYGTKQNRSGLYGSHLFENVCQHISRIIIMEQTMKLAKHFKVALSCHDEAVLVVDSAIAEEAKAMALEVFSTPPKWWPELPLAAEADTGESYAEAKQ